MSRNRGRCLMWRSFIASLSWAAGFLTGKPLDRRTAFAVAQKFLGLARDSRYFVGRGAYLAQNAGREPMAPFVLSEKSTSMGEEYAECT